MRWATTDAVAMTSHSENARWYGRCVLGCPLESPQSWPKAAHLAPDMFYGDDRKIFAAIRALNENNCAADIVSVIVEVGDTVPIDYVTRLGDGVLPSNLGSYLRRLRETTQERDLYRLNEQLIAATTIDSRRNIVAQMQAVFAAGDADAGEWRTLFHTREEIENAPPLRFAIDGFLQRKASPSSAGLLVTGRHCACLLWFGRY